MKNALRNLFLSGVLSLAAIVGVNEADAQVRNRGANSFRSMPVQYNGRGFNSASRMNNGGGFRQVPTSYNFNGITQVPMNNAVRGFNSTPRQYIPANTLNAPLQNARVLYSDRNISRTFSSQTAGNFYIVRSSGDKATLMAKSFRAGPLDVNINPRIVSIGAYGFKPYTTGAGVRIGRDNPPEDYFHAQVQVCVAGYCGDVRVSPRDIARAGRQFANRISSLSVDNFFVYPLPAPIVYPMYQQQEAQRGRY